jgi:sarcosine oxidase subunit beta
VAPVCKQVYLTTPLARPPAQPFTIDVGSHVYLRVEGARLLFGQGCDRDPVGFRSVDRLDTTLHEPCRAAVTERFPWLADHPTDIDAAWWGYYAVTPDHNPIIGGHPRAEGWIDATGFSGHGVMHAPSTGIAVSEIIADGGATTIDLHDFRHERFADPASADAFIF